ncbi:hypothetical protein A1D22_01550 [Pasteurellaceae bacterium LFhippo2]|nr:hypothetical protein [Pasteurellaceae bacterium LFhippo2]
MTELQSKRYALQNAVDSFKLESLIPSAQNLEKFEPWLEGKMNDKQLMESAYEIWQQARSLS